MTIDSVEELSEQIRSLTAEPASQETLAKGTADLLSDFNVNALPVELRHRRPDAKRGSYLVHREPGFTITSVIWGPGERTVPHDHQTWGTILVAENEIEETRFTVTSDDVRKAKLEVVDVHHHRGGALSTLYEGHDVHALFNATQADTFEIHIYGDDLVGRPRICWQPDGTEESFVSPPYQNC